MATSKGTSANDFLTLTEAYSLVGNVKKALSASNLTTDLPDTVEAGAGNDFVEAGYGNDRITGGQGKDTIYAGYGTDTVWGDSQTSLDTSSDNADMIYGGAGLDNLFGATATTSSTATRRIPPTVRALPWRPMQPISHSSATAIRSMEERAGTASSAAWAPTS